MRKWLFTVRYNRFDVFMILLIAAILNTIFDAYVW